MKHNSMQPPSDQTLWNVLLELRLHFKTKDFEWKNLIILFQSESFTFSFERQLDVRNQLCGISICQSFTEKPHPNFAYFILNTDGNIHLQCNTLLSAQQIDFFGLYFPFCFIPKKAREHQKAISILHLAQTLDGKIATNSGHSKWISNEENLIHSHRMRALCDAILIGANTLRADKPTLTVRHVNGPNPVKIVLGSNHCTFDSLLQDEGKVIFFSTLSESHINGIECICVKTENSRISSPFILEELYKRGMYSIYIEGGATTASQFMADKSVNYLQLFLAPRLFGSGIQSFALPCIDEVGESVNFAHTSFQPMGNGILFNATL